MNKTVYDGSNIINLVSSPNYNVTLSPGTYTWNFTTTDLAGNIAFVVSQFAIFNSSTNMTTNETNVTEETTTNATISFDSSTATDNDLTNQSSVSIKINANTNKSTVNLTLNIFDSAGRVVYKNSTTEKTIDVFHTFVSDGDYYYNATLISGEETINTPTRKITIDTESPTITIISPTKTKNNFTNYAVIDFSADDTNGIARRWINDGTKDTTYTSRINKSLTEGSYSWTVFAQDDAGNIAEEIIKFSIVSETAKKPNKNIAIFVIIIAAILIIVLIAWYFLKKKPEQPSTPNQTFGSLPPANPSLQFNRPLPPRSPPFLRPTPMPMNPAMFKNNPVQQ